MEGISEIQKVGRRLDSLKNHIREKSPKEVWIIDKIHILFVKLISTGIEKRIELETIRELNDLVDSFEFRFGQMFEQKINIKNRLLIREAIINLLEENSKFSEGDAVTTKEGDKGVVTFGKHPFYAVKLDSTGTTHSYHFSDLELDPTVSPEGMDFGKYDTTEPEEEQPLQESSPQDIVHLDGLLTVHDDLNITDVMSDIRSITGITIVKPIDIPGESHKNKLKIKIDPYPFQGIGEDVIKQKIKTTIRKIPGVKEFWSGVIKDTLQEKRYRII